MRSLPSLLLLACAGGDDKTEAQARSVDAACVDTDPGDPDASADQIAGLDRGNCYRALMGLDPGVLEARLDAASQAHTDYMKSNNTLTHQETAGKTGYTGEWVWDRAEAEGYPFTGGMSMGEVVAYGSDPAGSVDGWMNSVYHRLPFASPEWREAGFGQTGLYSGMTVVTPWPDSGDSAILYPVDGQLDVPFRFDSDGEFPDPAPDAGMVGPPITVTVGSADTTRSTQNPYDLQLLDASLEGPDGAVDLISLTPDDDPYMVYGVAVVPTAPLSPGAEYTVSMTVSWTGGEETLEGSFTTAEE